MAGKKIEVLSTDFSSSRSTGGKALKIFIFLWPAYFFLTAALILGTATFFQIQIISLQTELVELKKNLSGLNTYLEENHTRSQRKRSSGRPDQGRPQSEIQAAHLDGVIPFQHIEKEGRIGPWSSSGIERNFIRLREANTEVEIAKKGVYFIYAQVSYLTSEPHNSFQILRSNGTKNREEHQVLSTCSSRAWENIGEVSCYTGIVKNLNSGERLYLNQVEQNRIIHFGDGSSFFGIVFLKRK